MEYIIGILLLISFVGLAVYAVRGGNLMMGMLIMAIIWTVLPLIGNTFATNPEFIGSYPGITDISVVDAITKVFQSGPEGWGNVLVNVVFGAWFGRVLLQTGIADALIRKAVLGVAGGSMVRADKNGVKDVGPRSAHIAGLDYAVFTPEEEIVDPKVVFFSPKEGDPEDYVAIELKNGKRITITNTCAANVLGLIKPEYFAYGNANAARKAMQPLADYMGKTVEEVATQILTRAYEKIEPIIMDLADKYRLEKDQISLVGVGGGAAALIGFCSDKMGLRYSIPDNAEVISSIGVALAMVRDVVERVVPNPTPEDIRSIKAEAIDKAVESGAAADSVDVHIEIDPQTSKLTAIALGSTEVKTTDLLKECTAKEARELAAEDLKVAPSEVNEECATKNFYVFAIEGKGKHPVRILDKKGFIKVQRNDGKAILCKAGSYRNIVSQLWEELAIYQQDAILRPDYYICAGARVMDFSGSVDLDKIMMLMEVEMQMIDPGDDVIIVGAKNSL